MRSISYLALLPLMAVAAVPAQAQSDTAAAPSAGGDVLTGDAAFGGWEKASPGTVRLIRPSDLPAPATGETASNPPETASKPADAKPSVMQGFTVEEFAADLEKPRVIQPAPNGDILVADSDANQIVAFRTGPDGSVTDRQVFADGLDQPYGIAFYPPGPDPKYVYVGNTGSVVRFPYDGNLKAAGAAETIVPELPTGYHWTRDLVFSPDGGTLYVAVGSGSNIGEDTMDATPPDGFVEANPLGAAWGGEKDRADVLAFDPDGGDKRIFATGLRNCSGMTLQPDSNALWCVVNERDRLGNNLPPDYATAVTEGAFYGWPWYYIGGNEDPRLAGQRPDLADKVTVPDVLFQAHSAPLGITFYTAGQFPAEMQGDAFVAMHGSWNRDHRTGYKVVRLPFENGKPTGAYEDFMTGFVLDDQSVWGRPVDVAVAPDGDLLVSDDGSGRIWRVTADGAGETSSTK